MSDGRPEDLNPSSEELEEKVRRMMDPALPDEPEQPVVVPVRKKAIKIQAVSSPAEPELPSAPELPAAGAPSNKTPNGKVAVTKKSKKVVIPIAHHDDEKADGTDLKEPAEKTAPPVKKITITEHAESTEEVAEKLDEAIAELDTNEPNTSEAAKIEEPITAPEIDTTSEAVAEIINAPDTEDLEPIESPVDETPLADPVAVTDPKTDKAVDAIVAAEGDELLEIEDAVRDTDVPIKPAKKPRRTLAQRLKALWSKPGLRWAVVIFVVLGGVSAGAVPTSRYFLLNSAGLRATSSLQILDQSTRQPLKNVTVKLGTSSGTTDENGTVSLQKIKLGTNQLSIQKRAFAPVSKTVVVGWGSNPLGNFNLTPTGSQYAFTVTDFLSGKPLAKVEASSGEASAVSDEKGEVKLTIDKLDDAQFVVSIKADGFRTETVSINPDDKTTHAVKLVPARKQVFISKRSGKYDMYSVYIDGKEEKLILAASGSETENMVLVPHPSDDMVAYVSTRAGQHNSDGFLLSNLILINTQDGTTTNVGASERIQIVDWLGDRLVYVQIAAGSSANSPKRYRLMSYNYKDGSSKELASSNYFNDVVAANGALYYAPSSAYQAAKPGFYKINPDGSGQQTIFDQEVWNIFRTSYDHLALSVQQQWYDYHFGDKGPTKLNSAPANQTSRVYIDSPDAAHGAWVDQRDGKGVLLSYDIKAKTDATLTAQSGLGYPVRWLNSSVLVYRIKTSSETADYAISIDGGDPVKIRDVTNSGGIDRWYYY